MTARAAFRDTDVRCPKNRSPAGVELRLLNTFELRSNGESVQLPMTARRLLAFLALRERVLQRGYVAGSLWIDLREDRAQANLRSTLWRVNSPVGKIIDATATTVALASDVRVDLREAIRQARAIADGSLDADLLAHERYAFTAELLPDWYEDWILLERERYRQLVLHALETLSERLSERGRFAEAADAALAAIASEPLRESAHRALIHVHLAEGNFSEAVRQYSLFRRLLSEQLNLEPSPQLQRLIHGLTSC